MQSVIDGCEQRMKKCVLSLSNEYQQLRTGRASASLFERLKVEYYGAETPLSQISSISVPEARTVVIQPWDKTVLSAIEKAIQKSELGLNPNNDGKLIRVNFPPLTQERRKELAKSAKSSSENAKVAVRNVRRDAMEELKKISRKTARIRYRNSLISILMRSISSLSQKRKRLWRSNCKRLSTLQLSWMEMDGGPLKEAFRAL